MTLAHAGGLDEIALFFALPIVLYLVFTYIKGRRKGDDRDDADDGPGDGIPG